MTGRRAWISVAALAAGLTAGCGGSHGDACASVSAATVKGAFVFVQSPRSGQRVASGFEVQGCSTTYEANVTWRLRAANGTTLARGYTQGGGLEPGAFRFTVSYASETSQVGQLEVAEPTVTTEGHPPVKNLVPLILDP